MTQKSTFEKEITCLQVLQCTANTLHPLAHYLDEYSCRALSALAPAMVNITLHLTIQKEHHLMHIVVVAIYIIMHKLNNYTDIMTLYSKCQILTYIILAGDTLSFVHETLMTCVSHSLGTILAWPVFLLSHSRANIPWIAHQPKSIPSKLKDFVPPGCEENKAFGFLAVGVNEKGRYGKG